MQRSVKTILKSQGFKNTLWSLIGATAFPILIILSTPFLIHKLGTEQFGIWILVNTLMQILSSVNLGLGDSTIKSISEKSALGQNNQINSIVSNSLFLTLILVFAVALIALLISFLPPHFLPGMPDKWNGFGQLSIRLAILIFVLKFVEQIMLSIMQGFGRYDLASRILLISKVFVLLVNVGCAYIGLGVFGIIVSSVVGLFFMVIVEFIFLKRQYTFLKLRPSIDGSVIKSLLSYGLWSWVQSIIAVATTQLDKLIVAFASGLTVLTYYSIGSMLMVQIHGLFYSASSWLFPSVAKRKVNQEPLLAFYRNSQIILFTFGLVLIITLLCFKEVLFTLWLGKDIYVGAQVFIKLFLYYNLFLLLNIVPYFFLNGAGEVKSNTVIEFILKASNIIGMIFLHYLMGDEGLVWGLIISTAVITPIRIYYFMSVTSKQASLAKTILQIAPCLLIIIAFEADLMVVKLTGLALMLLSYYYSFVRESNLWTSYFKMPL